ncbi:hypothetical protein N752_03690 [Desulforamulus aquiferis]|nr:hypothetical protein N752_03690 [Desulforamulus aquiferis]
MPRRSIVIGTQVSFMVLALVLTLLSFNGLLNYWHIIALSLLMGILHAIDIPARQSFLVEMVGREDLSNAIALNSSMFNSARIIGPALGGIILANYGAATCFLINTASFFFVIVGLMLMKLEKIKRVIDSKNIIDQIKTGINIFIYTWSIYSHGTSSIP